MQGEEHLGFIIQEDIEINNDVAYRIGAECVKWRLKFEILCYTNVLSKGKFYKVMVIPTLIYHIWGKMLSIYDAYVQKINIATRRIFRWMCWHIMIYI
ncbi:hypothetical protein H5410_006368 [Solanum commersonii]|uniref:Uncharacterized protein n=1 Tax=Solanum commersonii TaxID=4109 RepID=A0A9J6A8Z1_SOLCO|nr:hypothetical protein H5410_006368 [Solanum commersonii]